MDNTDTLEKLLQTLERNAKDNSMHITNVDLFVKSWRTERKLDSESNEKKQCSASNARMKSALKDIMNWDEDLEMKYDDIGQRAKIGLGFIH